MRTKRGGDAVFLFQALLAIFSGGIFLFVLLGILRPDASAQPAVLYRPTPPLYNALIGSTNAVFEQSGAISIEVSHDGGSLSGKLELGKAVYPLKASFQTNGSALIAVKGTPLTVSLAISPSTDFLTGTVSSATWSDTFGAASAPYSRYTPAPQAGRYTLLLSPSQSGGDAQGNGYATMEVSTAGVVSINGRSENGAPFATSASIDSNGFFPFYAVTRGSAPASLHGWVQFRSVPNVSDCDGTQTWSEAGSGTSSQVALIGSRYVAPAHGKMALPFPTTQNNSVLGFGASDITFVYVPITLSATQLSSTSAMVSDMKLNVATGAYSGKLTLSGSGGSFYGVAFQSQGMGGGVLVGRSGAGWMLLTLTGSNDIYTPPPSPGSTSITSYGSGTVILTGSNTYSGGTTVSGGTLTVNGSLNGSGLISSGGTLQLGNSGLPGSGTIFILPGNTITSTPILATTGTAPGSTGGISVANPIPPPYDTGDEDGGVVIVANTANLDVPFEITTDATVLSSFVITGGSLQVSGPVALSGSGSLTLNTGSTYAGSFLLTGSGDFLVSGTEAPLLISGSDDVITSGTLQLGEP